jgi:UDP-N-acetylglucosamine 2-epimerase (non-hydrolysing)
LKIMTVLGTRPEIIRLSLTIKLLDRYADHVLVHTGQNYDDRLSDLFFRELGLREPNHFLGVRGETAADQIGQILWQCEQLFLEHRPDRLLILGDTNSGLSSIIARRLGVPVYHLEAGNRCYDDRVPEEVNRRIIDHSSNVLMPYTNRSRENLLREGVKGENIYVVGNPIKEVLDHFADPIRTSTALQDYGLQSRGYFLVTMHRAENVDNEDRLRRLLDAFVSLHRQFGFPVICSLHPRTRSKISAFNINPNHAGLRFVEPLGFFDFVRLEQSAFCLLSDSGTVQEEGCILGTPNVTIRDVTERPETVECGSNALSGSDPEQILQLVEMVTREHYTWEPPAEYLTKRVAEKICRIMLGYRLPDLAEQAWRNRK